MKNENGSTVLDEKRMLAALTELKRGNFDVRLPVEWSGLAGKVADTFNDVAELNQNTLQQLHRLSQTAGKEGKLQTRAAVPQASAGWTAQVDAVNTLMADMAQPVTELVRVIGSVSSGDLTLAMPLDVEGRPLKGEFLAAAKIVNTMVSRLNDFSSEVTRVAREVGTDGKLGGQAKVKGVAGTWKDLTDNVNSMAANLTSQVRNIADVTTAVARGDLNRKITVEAQGEILELKNTINTMVDQLNAFASEVTRVAREVGTDGKLGGQGKVEGVAGTWKDLTDNVNSMAANLTSQVRNIADVTTAVARGDLNRKITVEAQGEILELKNTINAMVDQLSSFASEVTRVAREVGTEGKLGGQAEVLDVAGTWKDLTDSVNGMAANLTNQVRNLADVTTAFAKGDLSKKITVDVQGEFLQLKNTVNTMVDQLSSFASEVTRVAREVGTEGKLGGQADVEGVGGTWKDLTDNVNLMASNLTSQVRKIAEVTISVASGDLSKKITVDVRGEFLRLKETMNTMVDQLRAFASEVTRVAREVGTDGKLGGQAYVQGVSGTWKDLTDNVNFMAGNLTNQVRNIADVTTAVARGDLTKKITVDAKGEILELKNTINTMVDQLNGFASEVTRVAREVGTDGKLGGQADVRGVAGTWKDLTDNVNSMAANLTDQVRGIVKVVTAVAEGNLRQQLTVQAKGEIAALSDTINDMTDTLATFADQVTSVAREVGVEGKLGGQANVPGAAGTWKDLTDNVNQLAANLTGQVRAISEVAVAVTKGDLSQAVRVEAMGEVALLKDTVNKMIANLKETTEKNTEQDWLKTNLAKFTRMLQGQKDLVTVARMLLSDLAPVVHAQYGVFYAISVTPGGEQLLKLLASYAFKERKNLAAEFKIGEGLVGQCAFEKQRILLTNVPGDYVQITSGLGEAKPLNIIVLPVIFEGNLRAVVELASFEGFSVTHQSFLDQLADGLGIVVTSIEANTRTEDLLKQSQSMSQDLKAQQEELQQTNEELEMKARLLAEQNKEVEQKNREIDVARATLEERAAQLALTSKYKSEFLANMSHELRTPLNSLLILSEQLGQNPDNNLTAKQVQFAKTIHSSGDDLLALISDILDLSKIESGTVTLDATDVPLANVAQFVEQTFRHVAETKGLEFAITLAESLPPAMTTDVKRLEQVLKNLLSNAFKFTEKGGVTLTVQPATRGWSAEHVVLNRAKSVIAFAVKDTGIGIPADKQKIIFEAFQQADGTTNRRYGGTGLGLSISREIARLLGGEIRLQSEVGAGSTFTLYVPADYRGPGTPPGDQGGGGAGPKPAPSPAPERATETPAAPQGMDPGEFPDDRVTLQPNNSAVLIVEDDCAFAGVLLDIAREKGFKGIVSLRGGPVLALARQFKPAAITLDIQLPDVDGWRVLEALKNDPETRHIPVHVITVEGDRQRGLREGAYDFLTKPADKDTLLKAMEDLKAFSARKVKRVLVVEDNEVERKAIVELLGNGDVQTTAVARGGEALAALKANPFDCVILDLMLPDIGGFEVLERIGKDPALQDLPVIVYTAKDLTQADEAKMRKVAKAVIVKSVRSSDRLLDETTLFLHRVHAQLPESKRKIVEKLHPPDAVLADKKVLIVDDDIRNIFSLTSVLERYRMKVYPAENGKEALRMLDATPGVDVVIMDIMMPEMDGYETTREIRKKPKHKALPIIALTAKAMKGDREKCIEAGASDYVAKPVNTDQLLSLLRVWLHK